jgi:hypothetical protein
MSLDYTGSSLGLFRHLGKLVKHFNQFQDDAMDGSTGLEADRDEITDAFDAGDLEGVIDGLASAYDRWKVEYVDRRATLARYMLARLQDRITILDEIGATSLDASEILYRLIDQMTADSQTVLSSSVTLGSVSAGGSNVGNGTVLTTKVLDGYSSPGARSGLFYRAHPAYNGLNSELAVASETMTVQCVEDIYDNQGVVTFEWRGKLSDQAGQYGIDTDGSGTIGNITEIHETTTDIVTNADFEDFTTPNIPDGWTIDSGTAGTHVKSNTSNVAHGSTSLQLVGDGAQATIKVAQAIASNVVNTNRCYALTAQVQADASIGAGTLTIWFEGTGYTAGASEKISIAPGSLPTSMTLETCLITMPASIPSDFKLVVKWDGTPTNAKNVFIDDIGLAPVSYGGGVGIAIVRGTTPFTKRDKFTFTVANSEGVFQKAFRQIFGVQLPSAGSPTIADGLAT